MAKQVLLFLGAPGSGKGTLAQRCCSQLDYEQVSTGNLCREHIAQGTQIGKKIDLALKSGKLVDDSVITAMVLEWFSQNPEKQQVILDGYPRTVVQIEALHQYIGQEQTIKPAVIHLIVDEQTVVDRLGMRLTCSKVDCQAVYSLASTGDTAVPICQKCAAPLIRRPDDEAAAIAKRLKLYSVHEFALLECYRRLNYEITALDAARAAEDIFIDLRAKLDAWV